MTDGAGTCFFSNIVYGYEKPMGWTDEDVDVLMREYLGCEQIIVLNPICLDGTGHIDLYAKLLSANSILLGEYPPDTRFHGQEYVDNPWNCTDNYINDYQDQEDNLQILESSTNLDGEPWNITRIPMPEPYLDAGYWVYRSYLNSEIFNNYVAMPSYYDPQGSETSADLLDMEAAAIQAYETALPGVQVTAIDADHIIPLAGAIHCIAHEIPAEAGGGWEPVATYCGDGQINGDEDCDGAVGLGTDCESLGLGGSGLVTCGMDCRYDLSLCDPLECGNGTLDFGEECDPCQENLPACADWGLGGGTVGCSDDCRLNLWECEEATDCEIAAALNDSVVCCPDTPPSDCDDSTWSFSTHSSFYGCCTADLGALVHCDDAYQQAECSAGYCGLVDDEGYLSCIGGPIPQPEPSTIICDTDSDGDVDEGKGSGDDGCGCGFIGTSPRSLMLRLLAPSGTTRPR
jgi:hypothetical protein